MKVQSASLKGHRPQNEDKHKIILNGDGHDKDIAAINLIAVFDGHGGKDVSKFLSESFHPFFTNKRVKYPLSKSYINRAYDRIQQLLRYNHRDFSYTTGSTCVTAIQYKHKDKRYLSVMNTGDSRCVLCRDNLALALTKDHKPYWPEENNRIKQLGGKIYFDGDWRVNGLSVSRAFGDVEAGPFVIHKPDIFRYQMHKTDKFLILACDGLWDVMSNQEAVNFVLSNAYDCELKDRSKCKENVAKKLGEYAIAKGSEDNVTVVIAFVD